MLLVGTSSLTLVRVDDVEVFVTNAIEDIEVRKKHFFQGLVFT